jgi:hypothetical protein
MKFTIVEDKINLFEKAFRKQFYKEIDGKKIYIVDGEFIRTYLEKEFTNFSQHFEYPDLIPEKEIWLDEEAEPGEMKFYITHALEEYDKMSQGEDYDTAHETATEKESTKRKKTMQRKDDVRIKLWKKLEKSKLKIFIVDGEAVRNQYSTDFTEGGHWLVYNFIPKGEVWIDNDISVSERKYILAHEIFEIGAMQKRGLTYDQAHKLASKYEKQLRQKS